MLGLFENKENKKQREFEAQQAEINRQFQHDEATLQYQRQQELNKQQNDWNIEQWNRTNEYNSPSQEVKRLRAAGLNPAMHTSLGGNSSASEITSADSSAPAAPSGSAAHGTAMSSPSGFQQVLQTLQFARDAWALRQEIAESKNRIKVSNEVLPYQIGALEADAKNKVQQALDMQYKRPHMLENIRKQNQYITQQVAESASRERLNNSQIGRISKLTGAEFANLLAQAKAANASGNWDSFKTQYAKQHGITIENSNWLQKLIQTSMENPDEANKLIDNMFHSLEKIGKSSSQKVGSFAGRLFNLTDSVGNLDLFTPVTLTGLFGGRSWSNPLFH